MLCTATLQAMQALEWGLDAADAPAWYVVLDDSPGRMSSWLANRLGGLEHVAVIHPDGPDWIEKFLRTPANDNVGIVAGGLSSMRLEDRPAVNAARDRLLTSGRKLVLVEPTASMSDLKRDFPDMLSVVREIFEVHPIYERDYLYDSGEAWRLRTIAARLPAVITAGATIIQGGRVHFKNAPQVVCPRCGQTLLAGSTTLTFCHAPPAQQEQVVSGWVCQCGEAYVPGAIAREAHAAAFRYREGQDEFEIQLSNDEKHRLLHNWIHHGPQGPIDGEEDPELP